MFAPSIRNFKAVPEFANEKFFNNVKEKIHFQGIYPQVEGAGRGNFDKNHLYLPWIFGFAPPFLA